MRELRIIKGADIELYAGDTPLFGVIELKAVKKQRYHEVYEYLNAAPCDYIAQNEVVEIELTMMSLFDKQLPTDERFTLRVEDGDSVYCYENCRVTGQKTAVKGSGHAVEVFTIQSDKMRKRGSSE